MVRPPVDKRVGCEVLLRAAPHLVDPKSGYRVWFATPNAIVGELALGAVELDDRAADFICGELWSVMKRRNTDGGRFSFVHDWSGSTTYTKQARSRLLQFMLDNHRISEHCGLVLSSTNAFARVGALTAAAAIRLVGFEVRVGESVHDLMASFGLRVEREHTTALVT